MCIRDSTWGWINRESPRSGGPGGSRAPRPSQSRTLWNGPTLVLALCECALLGVVRPTQSHNTTVL
eukprot:8866616-Pyramimonas_sp.AAC.1